MSHLSASFSATIRVRLSDAPGSFARLAKAIGDAGGSFGAIDLVRVDKGTKVRDVTVEAADADHLARIVESVRSVEGIEVERVSDRTFLMHLGGKIEMRSKVPVKTRDDLSMAYTPGVARICQAIADDPDSAWNLTIKQNTVAVVSDGTAVLGLGDIGPKAAMPVMEGKALLFKEFGGVDAWPLCLDTKDPDEIVAIVKAIAPGFGGINLEDISAPRCFEIEQRLRAELDIPVFHDDQHGTAIVVLAALLNALKVVGKRIEDVKVVTTGVGAAGVAVTDILLNAGVRTVIGCDHEGAIYDGREGLNAIKAGVRGANEPRPAPGRGGRRARGRRRLPRALDARRGLTRRNRADGRQRDRLRDGEPDARDRTRGPAAREGRRRRDGTVGLPEPDQQRARVPRRLPRCARRTREHDHRGHEGRSGPRDRLGDRRRRARAGVRDPERVQPRRDHARRAARSPRRPSGRRRAQRAAGRGERRRPGSLPAYS